MKKAALFTMTVLVAAALKAEPFADGERIAFFGDSITYIGWLGKMTSDFYLTRYPDRKISFFNCGVGGDTLSGGIERFEDDVVSVKPTSLAFMFGMNDIGRWRYKPDPNRTPGRSAALQTKEDKTIAEYRANLATLVSMIDAKLPGVKLYWETPSPYDETVVKVGMGAPYTGCNGALRRCASEVRALRDKRGGGTLVDFNAVMNAFTSQQQETNAAFSLISPDRVHPQRSGYLFMTYVLLKSQGVDPIVSDVVIDAAAGTCAKSVNATVSGVMKTADGVTFRMLEKALPWVYEKWSDGITSVAPITEDLNREILAVTGLAEEKYTLEIDGEEVGVWTGADLAKGVNLATHKKTPQYKQAAAVSDANRERADLEASTFGTFMRVRFLLRCRKIDPDDFAAVEKFRAEKPSDKWTKELGESLPVYLEKYPKRDEIRAELRATGEKVFALSKPVEHAYSLAKK